MLGLDWRMDIDEAWKALDYEPCDPGKPRPGRPLRLAGVHQTAGGGDPGAGGERNGHIFNLGHGILPTAPIDNVKYMIDLVHELSARK